MDSIPAISWQILDVGSIWMKEFASALSKVETITAWSPIMEKLGIFRSYQTEEVLPVPPLKILRFPLQRGYARSPLRWIAPFQDAMIRRMKAQMTRPEASPLICSTPFYAPVAELWPGPVIYYVTEMTTECEGLNKEQFLDLDRRMCRVARAVCPNSQRIADYLVKDAGCDPAKIAVMPDDTTEGKITGPEGLGAVALRDGQETECWEASKETWAERIRIIRAALRGELALVSSTASGQSDGTKKSTWHVLDTGTIMMKEFASALSKVEHVAAWSPAMRMLGTFRNWQRPEFLPNPALKMLLFPLQRGYSRAPFRWIAPFQDGMIRRMLGHTALPEESTLVCTTPFYAPVAELWPGPVIYYVTDLNIAYDGLNPLQVRSLDQRLCRVARVVCPNSRRIADYLITEAGCDPAKITIVPNATRESNILSGPRHQPARLPPDIQSLPRPIAGVLGDLSGNMNWELIADAMERTPQFTWLFVGPTSRSIADKRQRTARTWAKHHARFVGMKAYGELQAYASCLDVAVLPYKKREPTYSGSSTRFYEHLAAGRPMIATRGFAELLEKEPLLTLVNTGEEMAAALEHLRSLNFQDGYEAARWEASKQGTWEVRANTMRQALRAAEASSIAANVQSDAATVG